MASVPDADAAPPTPVTVITGWLGSGKSTLLAHVLHERHGHRIAVIQNELASGDSLAEQVSLISETGERYDEWVELPNGCLCCSVRDKLTVALESLMERRGQFDHILIETTGVANPGALASTFWLDDALESRLMLDGIVTLVDAANVLRHVSEAAPLAAPNEVVQQIAYADHIILNKVDLVPSEAQLGAVERTIRGINALAPILRAERAHVDLGRILGTRSFQTARAREVSASMAAAAAGAYGERCAPCDEPPSAAAVHSIGVQTCTLRARGRFALEPLKRWLCDLLWERPELTVYRMKGVLHVAGDARVHVLQAVHEVWDLKPCEAAAAEADERADERGPANQLVVIAASVDAEALEREWLACMSPPVS